MTTKLDRYRRIAQAWPELREPCWRAEQRERYEGLPRPNCPPYCDAGCGGSGWTPKTYPMELLRALRSNINPPAWRRVAVHSWDEDAEDALLTAVELLLGLEAQNAP